MDCLFCKIANNKIPSSKLYEDKDFLAILDISPVNKGHTLIMPKKHYATFLDLPKKELNNINSICQKVAKAIVKATNANGFNLMLNNNKAAGQAIDHVHFHIIPRYQDDGHKHWPGSNYKDGEQDNIAAKIKRLL